MGHKVSDALAILRKRTWLSRALCAALALAVARVFTPLWCGQDAAGWYEGSAALQRGLAAEQIAFEASDTDARQTPNKKSHLKGEWALVTHQMTALGLAQLVLAHPEWRAEYGPILREAALRSFLPEMRDFGTRAWHGEDAMTSLGSEHGHAYLAYPALALGMARLTTESDPYWRSREGADTIAHHDALIAAYVRRLSASKFGLIETYPGQAFPTDVAAVAAAIAVHGRVTGKDRRPLLALWADNVRAHQVDHHSGLILQRMNAFDGSALDLPRGSGTGLAAYYAGFADRALARTLTESLLKQEASFFGFGAIREYLPGKGGSGDIDSGPVILGVSVAATGFALAPARSLHHKDAFERIYRTTALFGMPLQSDVFTFRSGGPIGNALMLALLTSGPELAAETQ
jgi:hypothetical protein